MNKQHFTETQILEGAFLGILGEGVPTGSPNPDPVSDQKMLFSRPFSDLAFKKLCHHFDQSLLRLQQQQKIGIFLFLSFSFGTETINTFVYSRSALENHTRFQTKMSKLYTRFQTKRAQRSFGAAHTYIGEYPPGPDNTDSLLACSLDVCHVCPRKSILGGLEELVWRSSKL